MSNSSPQSHVILKNKLASSVGAEMVSHNDKTIAQAIDEAALLIENAKKINTFIPGRIRASSRVNAWGIRTMNILGDSISHGANVADIPNDSWVGIFRKMVNAEFGANNYGFCSINSTISNAQGTFQELHNVSTSGTWATESSVTDDSMMNGYAFKSSTVDSKLTIIAPVSNKYFKVWYKGNALGSYELRINGLIITTESTAVASGQEGGWYWHSGRIMEDNFYGSCTIEIIVKTGEVQIMGVSYLDADWREFQLNNFSQSGRRIQYLSEQVIDRATKDCEALVFALNHNDQNSVGADQLAVIANINHLIAYANTNDCKVYILDFCWHADNAHWLRVELERARIEINKAELVSFPDMFNLSGDVATTNETITELSFLSDSSHPTMFGHRVIAETLAKVMGLSVNAKKLAAISSPTFKPLTLINGWRNNDTAKPTAWRRSGNKIEVRFNLRDSFKVSDIIATLPVNIHIETTQAIQYLNADGLGFGLKVVAGIGSNIEFVDMGSTAVFPFVGMITAAFDVNSDYLNWS